MQYWRKVEGQIILDHAIKLFEDFYFMMLDYVRVLPKTECQATPCVNTINRILLSACKPILIYSKER